MRLTVVQMFKKSVNGHIFRGKKRLVHQVGLKAMANLSKDYEVQENNMLLLRHPFLTLEESSGHAKELGKEKKFFEKCEKCAISKKMKPHVYLEDRLLHLRVTETWD